MITGRLRRSTTDLSEPCYELLDAGKILWVKLAKESFSLRKLHRYSRVSVQKIVAVSVLLVGATVSAGVNKKTKIQKVAEW